MMGPRLTWHLDIDHPLLRRDIGYLNRIGFIRDICHLVGLRKWNDFPGEEAIDRAQELQSLSVDNIATIEKQ